VLDATQETHRDFGPVGEIFLRQAALKAKAPHVPTDDLRQAHERHRRWARRETTNQTSGLLLFPTAGSLVPV
jgi:hypothetical protein